MNELFFNLILFFGLGIVLTVAGIAVLLSVNLFLIAKTALERMGKEHEYANYYKQTICHFIVFFIMLIIYAISFLDKYLSFALQYYFAVPLMVLVLYDFVSGVNRKLFKKIFSDFNIFLTSFIYSLSLVGSVIFFKSELIMHGFNIFICWIIFKLAISLVVHLKNRRVIAHLISDERLTINWYNRFKMNFFGFCLLIFTVIYSASSNYNDQIKNIYSRNLLTPYIEVYNLSGFAETNFKCPGEESCVEILKFNSNIKINLKKGSDFRLLNKFESRNAAMLIKNGINQNCYSYKILLDEILNSLNDPVEYTIKSNSQGSYLLHFPKKKLYLIYNHKK